nr:MAG TPA: hypothetical protein [Caudoviricetes sp.]
MNEKLLPTTAGTLDENELKKAINSNSVYGAYGTYGIADVRLTCMNDQVWMDIGKPYLIPLDGKLLTREDICKIVDTMIANAGYPDARNLRILAGTTIMKLLSCIPGEVPDHIVWDRATYVHDKWMKPREMQLQQKRVTMRYDQFFELKPFDIYKDVYTANELSSLFSSGIANLKGTLTEAFEELFNLEENNMSRKSLEVKKVIYSGPCTIVIWADDSKTIVRCQDGDTYSKEVGLLMCLAKKVWGTNTSGSNFNDYISKVISEKEENE